MSFPPLKNLVFKFLPLKQCRKPLSTVRRGKKRAAAAHFWSFPKRGDWATHDAKWRGNWSPYANIIKYSEDVDGDLSRLNVKDFLKEMKKAAAESLRVLKKDKFCAVLMGDTRKKGCMIPTSFEVMRIFENCGFKLKELIIKEQRNCKTSSYWKAGALKYNFLLIAHEYLFVFRK